MLSFFDAMNASKGKGRSAAVVEICPDDARTILATARNQFVNRGVNENAVLRLAGAMRRGEFVDNGESLIFDTDGVLIDGQHRILAIIRSGVSVVVTASLNVPRDAVFTVDDGVKRTSGSVLTMAGYGNASTLASVARIVWSARRRNPFGGDPSRTQLVELVASDSGLAAAATVRPKIINGVGAVAPFQAVIYFARKYDRAKADEFLDQVTTGEGLHRGNPALAFRNRMVTMQSGRDSRVDRHRHNPSLELWDVTASAWNAHVRGNAITKVQTLSERWTRPDGLTFVADADAAV